MAEPNVAFEVTETLIVELLTKFNIELETTIVPLAMTATVLAELLALVNAARAFVLAFAALLLAVFANV